MITNTNEPSFGGTMILMEGDRMLPETPMRPWPETDGALPSTFPDIENVPDDPTMDVVGRTLHVEIPRDELILTIARSDYHGLEQNQAILYAFARKQDRYCGAAIMHSESTKPHMHPNPDMYHKIRSFEPRTYQELGTAAAEYAEASFLYGVTHWQPGSLKLSRIYFGDAHANLVAAEDYVAVAYNARRAAELASLMGDRAAYDAWIDMSELNEQASELIWESYAQTRENWIAYDAREANMLIDDEIREHYENGFKRTLLMVHMYANSVNDIPEEVFRTEVPNPTSGSVNDLDRLTAYLERRHELGHLLKRDGDSVVVMSVVDESVSCTIETSMLSAVTVGDQEQEQAAIAPSQTMHDKAA